MQSKHGIKSYLWQRLCAGRRLFRGAKVAGAREVSMTPQTQVARPPAGSAVVSEPDGAERSGRLERQLVCQRTHTLSLSLSQSNRDTWTGHPGPSIRAGASLGVARQHFPPDLFDKPA